MSLREDQRPRSRILALMVSPSAVAKILAFQISHVGSFSSGMQGPRVASATGASQPTTSASVSSPGIASHGNLYRSGCGSLSTLTHATLWP